ncbi:hypothetical protein PVAG01_01842 [Phlyctema vagabunda]|uniref:Uncharacterized protein n=1 Tax=Phlyctema vagabunda TaxID=108571 RepID=A0ABR4PYS5_9HELO
MLGSVPQINKNNIPASPKSHQQPTNIPTTKSLPCVTKSSILGEGICVYSAPSYSPCSFAEGLYLRAKINFQNPFITKHLFSMLYEATVHEVWGYILLLDLVLFCAGDALVEDGVASEFLSKWRGIMP